MTHVGHSWKVKSQFPKALAFPAKPRQNNTLVENQSLWVQTSLQGACSALNKPQRINIKQNKCLLIFWEPRVFAFLFLSIPHASQYPLTCLGRNKPKLQPESPVSPQARKTCLTLHGKESSGHIYYFP